MNLRETSINKDTLEDFSKGIDFRKLIRFMNVYLSFEAELIQEYREAFLLHVFLMVHRITFDQQYMAEGRQVDQIILDKGTLVGKIEAVFAENNLGINQSEISALFSYIKKERQVSENVRRGFKIIEESQNREKLKQVIDLIEERLVEHAIVPTELQWTILINHLNEMLKRSQRKETIPVVDRVVQKKYPKSS